MAPSQNSWFLGNSSSNKRAESSLLAPKHPNHFGPWQIQLSHQSQAYAIVPQQLLVEMIKAILLLLVVAVATSFLVKADQCPHDLEVLCIDDINKAYAVCDKAAKEKGKDMIADLECLKFFGSVQKDCWPCICQVINAAKVHVKGCETK